MERTSTAGQVAPTRLEQGISSASSRLDALLHCAGVHGATARDTLGAVVWAVISVALVAALLGPLTGVLGLRPAGGTEIALILGLVTVQALTLAIRRVRPAVCLAAVAVFQVALIAMLPPDLNVYGAAPLIAAYTVGAVLPPRRVVWTVGTVFAVEVIAVGVVLAVVNPVVRAGFDAGSTAVPPFGQPTGLGLLLPAVAAVLPGIAAAATGAWVALRREQTDAVRARMAADLEDQRTRADAAATAERSRIARELHDIAAHHLSGLVVQASAAERLVDADPEEAKEMIRSVRAQGRRTLDNLRTAVGVLRESGAIAGPGAGEGGAPVPGLSALEGLLEDARRAGDAVELTIDGEAWELSPIADISAYRIVQEALANARRHAPGAPVTVTVHYDARALLIDVVNGPGSPPAGTAEPSRQRFGVIGMRERASLLGGSLEAGPTPDGGWRLRAHLPGVRLDAGPS